MEIYMRTGSSKEGRGRRTAVAGPAMLKASRSTREGRRTTPTAAMPRSLSSRSCGGGRLGKEDEEEEEEEEEEERERAEADSGAASGAAGAATPRSFSSRCAGLVKEQRARFYIMRRCVTMLICWRDYS